jgi:hypothetical protein
LAIPFVPISMSFFDELYLKLFPKENTSNKIAYEVIKRSSRYKREYLNWLDSETMNYQMRQLHEGYWSKKNKLQGNFDVHLLNSQYANGFALSYNEEMRKMEFQFLFDYLAEKIKLLNYKLSNSDVQITENDNAIETKEKHYLKPINENIVKPISQQYGNILIEHILNNDQPSYIKLIATVYSDSLYLPAMPFEDLINHIFKN